jgi:hypothetical protein
MIEILGNWPTTAESYHPKQSTILINHHEWFKDIKAFITFANTTGISVLPVGVAQLV